MNQDNSKVTGYIWYNPDAKEYQMGAIEEYDKVYGESANQEEFSLILELTHGSETVVQHIVEELNKAHKKQFGKGYAIAV